MVGAMARVLLVDDDAALVEVLALAFEAAGYAVDRARDGLEALERIARERPDAVVTDVNMPRLDGFSLCRRVRAAGDALPLVLLTSRDDEVDEALGLDLGADDYVTKPFSTRVLLARVAALLRREALRHGGDATEPVVRAGALTLDPARLEARWADVPLALTLTEFRLVEALARRPGVVLSRARLLELVRGDDSVVGERLVDVYVRRLRKKLEAAGDAGALETVVGAGYRWAVR